MIRKGSKVKWVSSVGNHFEGVVVGFIHERGRLSASFAEVKVKLGKTWRYTLVKMGDLQRGEPG